MKVDFLIVGTQKGGTTALAKFLSDHPQIYIPQVKEVHFFDNEQEFAGTEVNYENYHGCFTDVPPSCKLVGDATPIYMYWKPAPARIKEYNPLMKLIFIIRNPIERAYSQWVMEKNRRDEWLPFSLAIRLEKIRSIRSYPLQDSVYSYVDRGYYSKQIKRMAKYFPPEQMLFLKTENLRDDHMETLNRVCRFLGVDPIDQDRPMMIHTNPYLPMPRRDREYLKARFAREIADLEELLGWDCSAWFA